MPPVVRDPPAYAGGFYWDDVRRPISALDAHPIKARSASKGMLRKSPSYQVSTGDFRPFFDFFAVPKNLPNLFA
jgi:hypothetical protein